ncbi:MAG: YitT family protein [Lachnospiraceae bacterium]|nr:YitT family protein [Lachnospiraceae bacterium]
MNSSKLFQNLKTLFWVILGNSIYTFSVVMFIQPNGLVTGGTTGIALFLNRTIQFPVPVFVAIFNIAMFLLGLLVLGKKFAVTTVISTLYYPVALAVFDVLLKDVPRTSDLMLATICGALLIGAGIGIVIRAGASTGGMDIPPLVLNKKWNIPVAYSLYAFDVLILVTQFMATDMDAVLYGIVMVLIYTLVLNKVLVMGNSKVQVKIISKKYEEINQAIQTQLDRGSTLFDIEGGYLRNESLAVMTVLEDRELPKLNALVKSIDPKAFLIINQVTEVRGRGFTMEKKYVSEDKKQK